MKLRTIILIFIAFFVLLSSAISADRGVREIIDKLTANFEKIKDAQADITIDYNLHLFGCSGLRRMQGEASFKYPNKIKTKIDGNTYFAQGNRIRKIDDKGKKLFVRLINSINFYPGFNPKLIPFNFYLTLIEDSDKDIIIEGIPKPGVLKNITKVTFHIDPKEYLLRKMDLEMKKRGLSGNIKVDYEKIDNIWVPVGFHGDSAIELPPNILIGLSISLKGEDIKINQGLPDKLFNPGF
jgi:hypothetical protein